MNGERLCPSQWRQEFGLDSGTCTDDLRMCRRAVVLVDAGGGVKANPIIFKG